MFLAFGLAAVLGAIVVISASDPFISALSLIVNFGSLGAIYLTLHAPFVAVAQIIVYAGAVVVLFLFVLAYLGADRELVEEMTRARWARWAGVLVAGALAFVLSLPLTADLEILGRAGEVADSFGSPAAFGESFMTEFLLQFEATSIILLVAAIGGIVLGLTGRERHRRLRSESHALSADQHKRLSVEELRQRRLAERERRMGKP